MSVVITPEQFIYVSSFHQDRFSFGSSNEEVRTCRYINSILDMFGKNVVLSDGRVTDISIVDDIVSITISSGVIINDKTLINFDEFTLDSDTTDYTSIGAYIIVYTSFTYSSADRDVEIDPCPFYFKIGIIDSSGYPLDFTSISPYRKGAIHTIAEGISEIVITMSTSFDDIDYNISSAVLNTIDATSSQYLMTVSDKTISDFTVILSGVTDTANYKLSWLTFREDPEIKSGFESIGIDEDSVVVTLPTPYDDTSYIIKTSIQNTTDATVSQYAMLVTSKSTSGFTITLSGCTDTANYVLSWITTENESTETGIDDIGNGEDSVEITFSSPLANSRYRVLASLENVVDATPSEYAFTVVSKEVSGFTVELSGLTDSANYKLSWTVYESEFDLESTIIMCVYDIDNEKLVSEIEVPEINEQEYSIMGLSDNVDYLDLLDGGQL